METKTIKLQVWFQITEYWFKFLEFSLLIGILDYLRHKTGLFVVSLIYWISWGLILSFLIEVAEQVSKLKESGNYFRKSIIYFLIAIPLIVMWVLLNKVGLLIAENNLF